MTAAELFRELGDQLPRLVHGHVSDPAVVEDACSEAWAILCRLEADGRAPRFDDVPGARAWLVLVAKREAWRMQRRRGDVPGEEAEAVLDVLAGPLDVHDHVEARARVQLGLRAIAELPESKRAVYAARVGGASYAECCELFGASWTWVNRGITEGRALVREACS